MEPNNTFGKWMVLLLFAISFLTACDKGSNSAGNNKHVPAISTELVKNISYTSATISASLTSSGECAIIEKGICWATHMNPGKTDSVSLFTGGETNFSCKIIALQPNTTYHVRAFATNEMGTSYGADKSFKTIEENAFPIAVEPMLKTTWSVFTSYFNYYYPTYGGQNNISGKYPAACGPTTLARVLAYWGGRIYGIGILDGMNTSNEVRFLLNLDTLAINYANLPNRVTGINLSEYKDVAKIFLAAGAVSLTSFVDVGTPGDAYIAGLKRYFNVSEQVHFARRWDYTKEEWIQLLKNELAHDRPVMIAARTASSPAPGEPGNVAGHWFNIEGYDANDKFYINYNYASPGTFKGYFDVDNFGEYKSYGLAIIGFQPR